MPNDSGWEPVTTAEAAPVPAESGWQPVAPKPPLLEPGEAVGAPVEAGWEPVKPPDTAMPGSAEALMQGIRAGISEVPESAKALAGQRPDIAAPTSPAAAPLQWSDVTSPGQLLPKVAYQLGAGAPTLAAGVAGGVAGGLSPVPGGAIMGGAAGAGLGAAFQAVGPYFSEELKKSPNDPNGAWNSAMERATVSGAFSALGWAAFPLRIAQGPLKQLAFQAFGVQPAISAAEQATQSAIEGKPATEGLGQAYLAGAAGTLVPALGHAALGSLAPGARRVEPVAPERPQTVGDLKQAIAAHEQKSNDLQEVIDGKQPVPHYNVPYADVESDVQEGIAYERDQSIEQIKALKRQLATTPDKDDMAPAYREIDMKAPIPGGGPDPSIWDRAPFGQQVKNAIYGWQKLLQPEKVSDLALRAFGNFRQYVAASAQRRDSIVNAQQAMHGFFQKLSPEANFDFIREAETQHLYPATPENKAIIDQFRPLLDQARSADEDVGAKYGYVQGYFPRDWVQPDKVSQFVAARYPAQGMSSPGFQKARTFEFFQDALDAGFVPKTWNAADLVTNRLLGSAAVQEKVKLLQRLNQQGAAARLRDPGDVSQAAIAGWYQVKDPVGNDWAIHPDLKPLWDNVIASDGLWDRQDIAGDAFRKWMTFKNFYVPIKLTASLFHPLHVAHINLVDSMTRGWTQLTEARDPLGALGTVARGVYGQLANAIPYLPTEAKAAREAWLTPEWKQTPEQAATVKMMTDGGFSPQLSEQLRQKSTQGFHDALAQQDWLRAVPKGIAAGFRAMSTPIFEHWIPSLKTAAYLDEARALFERRPDLLDNDTQRKAALSTIAKSVDNRYGEMFYRGLFWNKALKDAGIGSFLSLGWNLGFAREFGGGALEPFLRSVTETPTQQTIGAVKSKTSFAFMYIANAVLINALMTKLMSGEDPDGMDYVLPRIGGINPDGSPRRVSNMFYTRELPMMEKHIEEQQSVFGGIKSMLWNKMMFEPFQEYANNRDYYGYNIWDENAPLYKRAAQLGKFIMTDQFNPITITGAKRSLQANGQWDDSGTSSAFLHNAQAILGTKEGRLALAGFGPAPSYAAKTPTLNRLNYLFSRYVSPVERPQKERDIMDARRDARNAYAMALHLGDSTAAASAVQKLYTLGVSAGSIKKVRPGNQDIYMFQRLPFTMQQDFLKNLSAQEFKRYYPRANKNTRADPEIRSLAQQYYQQ